jgi:hypothetical protein
MNAQGRWTLLAGIVLVSTPVLAGFASTEVFLPAVGRIAGSGGAQFFTTVWATNLTGVAETFRFEFLKQGQANGSPASFQDTLQPGETKVYENVVETKLGLISAIGAARVTSTGEIFVSERIFNQAPGADIGDTEGLFFAGVPKDFSIGIGQSASIQGLNQGGVENFRYNFALVETGGAVATVNVQVLDASGALLGQKTFDLSAFEQLQPNVADVVPGFSSINARITATVTGGMGSVLLAGAQLANVSQDSSGFEMSFRDELLGGAAGVTSLNGLSGALTITAGSGISITPSGSSIAIAFTGGGSSGITSVTHDASLAGAGTGPSPLGIAAGQVVRSVNGLHDAVTLAAGSNVTLTPSGSTITIAASGGGGGGGLVSVSHDASLTGDGTAATPLGVVIPFIAFSNSSTPLGGITNAGKTAVQGTNRSTTADTAGVRGVEGSAVDSGFDISGLPAAGVRGTTSTTIGVLGVSDTGVAIQGTAKGGVAVEGTTTGSAGIKGSTTSVAVDSAGVLGIDGTGTSGQSGSVPAGVLGESKSAIGVQGRTATGFAGVRGLNSSSADNTAGVFGRDGTGLAGASGISAGVRGESKTNIGVLGLSQNFGVVGRLASGAQGELASHRTQDWGVFTNNDIHGGNGVFTGSLTATNLKSFVEPHPTDPTKQLRFVCLEGPESGTYFRGSGHIVGGFAKIAVPESFRDVTDEKGLTVVATAVGGPGSIWVVRKGLNEIVLQANSDVDFDYVVNGVRKAYKDFAAIQDNQSFIPDGADDNRFALYAPEIQRRLVATGIYNPDGTVNLETAKRLGWDKHWSGARDK